MYRKIIHGNKMDFLVLSRDLARNVVPDTPYAIISITDESAPDAKLAKSPNCNGVLRLKFADLDRPYMQFRLFTNKDARRIVNFVNNLPSEVKCLVIHCEAGLSRSAGVAAALAKWMNNEDMMFFKYYKPNMLVYRTVLNSIYTTSH